MQHESTITCPHGNHRTLEIMPSDACPFFYNCKAAANVSSRRSEIAVYSAVMDPCRVHLSRCDNREMRMPARVARIERSLWNLRVLKFCG